MPIKSQVNDQTVRYAKHYERVVTVNGRAIRQRRDFLGMARRGISNLCGWSIAHQQNIEEQDARLRMSDFIKLCDALRLDWEEVIASAPEKRVDVKLRD